MVTKEFPVAYDEVIVSVDQVRINGGTQTRAELNQEVVAEYAEAMLLGAQFPPITLFFDSKDYWLADGFHRLAASRQANIGTIPANVRIGSRRDAVLYSVGANATHGLRRTNEDKKRAVTLLLGDEVWSRWSVNRIAQACAVSPTLVTRLRHELRPDLAFAPRFAKSDKAVYEFSPRQSTKPDEVRKLEARLNSVMGSIRYHQYRLSVLEKEQAKLEAGIAAAKGAPDQEAG
jgi:hypothetical protein